jgi:hypothetical protein
MKFTRPVYDDTNKVFTSGVKDGLSLESEVEESILTPSIQSLQSSILNDSLASSIIDLTKSWFSKPITKDWLLPRLECSLSTPDSSFEGKCVWTFSKLIISKEKFILAFDLQIFPAEKIQISFPEPEPPAPVEIKESKTSPLDSSDETTRQQHQKAIVLSARLKAAKALYKAERLTQAYVQTYGETDWEDELEEDSEP